MIAGLDRTLLSELSGFIAECMGLHFPEERWPDLARGFQTASQELGLEDSDATLCWLRTREMTARQIETLAGHLTVGETYFFREPQSFEALERDILPPLAAQRREANQTIRLWSAGCCTGEEAYSLAISCARALSDLGTWNVSILATDINPKFLAIAEAGVYPEWSFRGTHGWLRERFFSPAAGKKYLIDPTIRNLVRFGFLNLAEDTYPSLHSQTSAMDVIFCRNVLMYFSPNLQRRVAAALYRCLADDGCLLVSPSEAGTALFPMFAMENVGGISLYRKISQQPRIESWTGLDPPVLPHGVLESEPRLVAASGASAPASPVTPITVSPHEEPLRQARTCADLGRLEEALTACKDAITAECSIPASHFLCATICTELGRFEEAIVALRRVLYLDQDSVLAHHALGGLYKRLGRQKESRRHLAVALELLSARSRDEIVPVSDGMTCGRLAESVRAIMGA